MQTWLALPNVYLLNTLVLQALAISLFPRLFFPPSSEEIAIFAEAKEGFRRELL